MHKAIATTSTISPPAAIVSRSLSMLDVIKAGAAPTRTLADAYALARPLAQAGDRDGATQLICRLLWHVDRKQGGFIGLSDAELRAKCEADKRLSYAAANEAANNPGEWPAKGGAL